MNKVILMGRLTKDPELRQTTNNMSVCRFTIAVNRQLKNKETGTYDADFINCTAWRQTAEFISRYFSKGSMIALEGALRTGSYQDKNHSDVTHYTTDVLVERAEFCGNKQGVEQSQKKDDRDTGNGFANETDLSGFEEILSDGDVPF